jgi:hypothetical protein
MPIDARETRVKRQQPGALGGNPCGMVEHATDGGFSGGIGHEISDVPS